MSRDQLALSLNLGIFQTVYVTTLYVKCMSPDLNEIFMANTVHVDDNLCAYVRRSHDNVSEYNENNYF